MPPTEERPEPVRVACQVTVPARTSISVLDMNEFHAGVAGGGNVGFALEAPTSLSVALAGTDEVLDAEGRPWPDDRAVLVRYVLDKWRETVGGEQRYAVKVLRANTAHIGLASSAALQIAIWASLNHLFGHIFTDTNLRLKIAATYREQLGGDPEPGFTTGLSSFLGLYGGFAAVRSDLLPSIHLRVPPWSAAVVLPPGMRTVSFGTVEREALTVQGPLFDQRDGSRKLAVIADKLIPSVEKGDLVGVGMAIAELQQLGSKLAEIGIYGETITNLLSCLRQEHPCAYMSAVGPGIVVLSETDGASLAIQLEERGLAVNWHGPVSNEGMILTPADV